MSLAFDDIGPQIVFIVSPQINQQGKKAFWLPEKARIFAANNPQCPTYNRFHQRDTNNRRIGRMGHCQTRKAPKSPVPPPPALMTSKDDALRKTSPASQACRLAVVLSIVGCRWRSVRQSFCNPLTPAILQSCFLANGWSRRQASTNGSLTSGVKSMDEFVTLFMFMPKSDSLHSTDSMQLFVPCSRIRTLILGYSH